MASSTMPRRYVVATHRLFSSPWQTAISVSRMDGLPEWNGRGEAFNHDPDVCLSEAEAIDAIRDLIRALPDA